jgi:prolyl-tRNA editing enzyme YbaK/EbsC (Cys-tRNA(Pro) deacylase)
MQRTETQTTLPSSARRVQDYLHEHGFACVVVELPNSTRTAAEAAEAVGCSVAQIAKSLIFKNRQDDAPILVIASGANRVDVKKIEKQTGLQLTKADGTYVKEQVGFAIGGIPPVAHATRLHTILDQDLFTLERIWAAAGTPHALFELTPTDLQTMTKGSWLDLAV